jgi:hypothetical protein
MVLLSIPLKVRLGNKFCGARRGIGALPLAAGQIRQSRRH